MVLIDFPSAECVDDVVNNQTNDQFTSTIIVNFMTHCWIIKRPAFNVKVCSNHSWRYNHNQFEGGDEKPRHQGQFFQNLDNFYI